MPTHDKEVSMVADCEASVRFDNEKRYKANKDVIPNKAPEFALSD